MKKKWRRAVAAVMAVAMMAATVPPGSYQTPVAEAAGVTEMTEERVNEVYSQCFENKTYNRVSVHDPSIVVGYYEGTYTASSPVYGVQNQAGTRKQIYFVFGSHMAWAYSMDLKNWKTFENNINKNYAAIFASQGNWSKRGDSVYNISGNLWAPDVFWDASYENEDGTKGAWLMYMSINGCSWNSSISLLKATTLNGDWTYVDTIIYSGFTESGTYDYTATNYKEVTGDTSLPDRFKRDAYTCKDGTTNCAATTWQRSYGAHAIDPCIIEDGDKLWMTYGSWSGGIWMIEMDKATGLRKADFKPAYEANVSDPYMGYILAGGSGVSGEASYIQKIGDKYYLFISYGGLVATGGYNMRVFSADTITGPYKDLQGNDARRAKTSKAGTVDGTVGNRLMGYYKWDFMENGFTAEGHNSAFVDNDGKAYVIYHTRFDDGSEGHQLRVHQLFQAKNGGLVTAPFEYCGETLAGTAYSTGDVTGEYRVVKMQSSENDHKSLKCAAEQSIQLNANGTVTGDYTGTWEQSSDGPYVTLTSGGVTYQGVFLKQNIEETAYETMCLTLVGNNDISLWGYQPFSGEVAVAKAAKEMSVSIGAMTYSDLNLPADAMSGVGVTWSSSHPGIIASDGTVTAPAQNTEVTLTVTIQSGGYSYSKVYKTTVLADLESADTETGLKALYNFNDGMANVKNTSQTGEPLAQSKGKKPERIYNAERGSKVLHQEFGYTGDNVLTTSYAKYPNPLQGETLSGATISMWVNCVGQVDLWDAIWSFFDEDNSDGIDGRLYLTPNMYLGYNGTGGYFDLNHPDNAKAGATGALAVDTWKLVTVSFDGSNMSLYVDGVLTYTYDQNKHFDAGTLADRTNVLKLISSSAYFYTGYGSFWGSSPLYMDNIRIYNRALSELDVLKLYNQDLLEVQEDIASNIVDTSGYYYYNDYNTTDATVWSSVNAADNLSVEVDTQGEHKSYIQFAPGSQNSRSAYTEFAGMETLPDEYTIEFDTQLTAGNNQGSQFALATGAYSKNNNALESGYIWALQSTNTLWTISNGDTVSIPKASWVHIRTDISQTAKTAKLTITGEGVDYEGTITDLPETKVRGLFWLSGRYYGVGCFDNISVYAYDVAFDANGGTGTMSNQAFKVDTAAKLKKNEFKREGYTFGGWATSPDGDSIYADQKSVSNLTTKGGTVTLYAKWLEPGTSEPDPTEEPESTVAPTTVPASGTPTASPSPTSSSPGGSSGGGTSSSAPGVTSAPTVSQAPGISSAPDASQEPTASPEPTASSAPTVSLAPDASQAPSSPSVPEASSNPPSVPGGSTKPEVSEKPDNPTAPVATATPDATAKPQVTPTPSDNTVTEGKIYTSESNKYEVTSVKADEKTVTLLRVASNKSVKNLKVRATVKIKGQTFKVTGIDKKAFVNCKKLKSIVIGKNVKSLGAKCFAGCKNLKKITIKTKKLKKVGKNAFKNISKKAVIKVPKGKLKKYKKILRKKGLSSKVKIVKM